MLPPACLLFALLLSACHSSGPMLPDDRSDSAVQVVQGAHAWRSERGKLQLELHAPVIKKYNQPKPQTIYRSLDGERVLMRFFDDNHATRSTIEAGYAVSFDERNIMEAHDSVVVVDYSKGDTIYLQDLIWNSAEDRIYSEHPVIARNGNRVTEGDGFTSDQRLENMRVVHQRGTIEIQD